MRLGVSVEFESKQRAGRQAGRHPSLPPSLRLRHPLGGTVRHGARRALPRGLSLPWGRSLGPAAELRPGPALRQKAACGAPWRPCALRKAPGRRRRGAPRCSRPPPRSQGAKRAGLHAKTHPAPFQQMHVHFYSFSFFTEHVIIFDHHLFKLYK